MTKKIDPDTALRDLYASRSEALQAIERVFPKRGYETDAGMTAENFLKDWLGIVPHLLQDLEDAAQDEGISLRTLRRAFIRLGGVSTVTGRGKDRRATWSLTVDDDIEEYLHERLKSPRYGEDIIRRAGKMGFPKQRLLSVAKKMGIRTASEKWELPTFTKSKGALRLNLREEPKFKEGKRK